MKKRILMILITLTVLSSMILCALLGVTKAEYFKILSKKVGFEAKPDLELEYYIYHADTVDSTTFAPQRGTYHNSDSFIQRVTVGKKDTVVYQAGEPGVGYSGKGIVYQVKIPVNETGYYTLDFLTYMLLGTPNKMSDGKIEYLNYLNTDFYTLSHRYCVGCEVLTSTDNFEFGVNKPLDMANRIFAGDALAGNSTEPLLYSDSSISKDGGLKDSVYQWKTMSPYRAENVSLTFKAEQADVDKGYVIWAWDFSGLEGPWNHTLFVENLSVNKTMELDGTTKYRDSNTPYFMFPQTAYANNVKDTTGSTNNTVFGMGRNRYSAGRGTYVTEATDNSLGMRAELLHGVSNNSAVQDNPISLYIPLKNVQRGATYKVTFDFSVARQGTGGVSGLAVNGWTGKLTNDTSVQTKVDYHSYNSGFANIFNEGAWSETDSRMFQSYLVSGVTTNPKEVVKTSRNGHRDAQDLITYNGKYYNSYPVTSNGKNYTYGYPLTKYDEVLKYNKAYLGTGVNQFPNYTTSDNINDTYSKAYLNGTYKDTTINNDTTIKPTENRNFFNAVQHTEYNGQYEINWITFYNTTFSFNIANDVDLDDLYWVWAIDALRYTAFYNLRIENVRIERVVEFASKLDANGVKIGDNQIDTTYMDNYGRGTGDEDMGPFNNYRGWNSTGQNYQARGHATDKYLPKGNIYAPIIDASKFTFSKNSDYIIALDGKAVLKGGVDRYVYSIDGGRTWADMVFSGGKASADQLKAAEAGIDLSVKGQTPTDGGADMIKFNSGDAYNASFDNFALSVDLNKYKHQANLDIIIAAVPNDHPDYRCEILRIVNFNQVRNYVSFPYDFVSDIKVTNKIYDTTSGATTPLNAHRIKEDDEKKRGHYYYKMAQAEGIGFTQVKTVRLDDKKVTSTTAYTRLSTYSHAYEDVRTAWTGFAVKKTLGITGWAMVEGGVEKYVWSADGGKTWSDTSQGAIKRNLIENDYKQVFYDGVPAYVNGTPNYDPALENNYMFEDTLNGLFTGNAEKYGSMLTADLSGHVGEVVDVIFAAKPNNSEVYVPIGRVDNVAVYGDPNLDIGEAGRGMGTFYTRMHEVRIDNQLYDQGIRMTLGYTSGKEPYFARMNWLKDIGIVETALTYLEPYHVNPVNARFFNETVQEVNSGGKIEIEGFTVVEGGVKQYKYSLDGGETWTILYTSQQKNYSEMNQGDYNYQTQAQNAANAAGISLEGNNGNNVSYTNPDNATLIVNLPALPYGTEKNLLVVAESNIDNGEKNADGTSKNKGFIYPVLQMKIRIKNEGVGYFLNDANGAQAGRYPGTNISQSFEAGTGSTYKLTFPVSKEGVHTLTFNAALTGSGNITTSVLHEQTEKGGERYFASKEAIKTKGGTVDKIAIKELTNASTAQDVDFYFNATAEDVKRGYVVLDFDLSKLTSDATLNISNLMFKYGVTSVKTLNSSSNTIKLKLPALEVGKHEFKFSSHASTQYAIVHNGLNQYAINSNSAYKDYTSASMSVPKTTYTIGEPIHVNYNAAGTSGAWIGITRTIQSGEASREVIVGRLSVSANTGEVTFKPFMDSYEANAKDFAGLPAGSYKIYFRDSNQNIYGDDTNNDIANDNLGSYSPQYNVTDPISITIIDPNKSLDTPNYNTFYYDNHVYNDFYKSYGFVTLEKTVFTAGETIKFTNRKYLANDAIRVVLCKANDNTILDWTWQTEFNNSSFASPGDDFEIPSDAAPGQYQVMFLYDRYLNKYPNVAPNDSSINRARGANTFYGVIDITVLPAGNEPSLGISEISYGKKEEGETTEIYNELKNLYSYQTKPLTVNITEDDVTKGYIEVEYTFEGLPSENIVYTTDWVYDRDYGYSDMIYERKGDYLYFGWYPQTLLPENEVSTTINADSKINALGFYKGTDNNYYAKVMADPYGSGYKFDDGTTVTKGTVYYFKVEPIKWRIVSENDVEMTVLCESIIDSMAYGHTNNYEESAVREWLTKNFYETAFSEKQRALIHSMTLDNSAASTGFDVNTNICADTEDMIYLPSYSNVKYYSSTVVRAKNVSDFAMATGTYANSQGKGNWMLRSPMNTSRDRVRAFDTIGNVITNGLNIAEESNGIVPMLTLYYKSGDEKERGDMTYVVPPDGFGGVTGGNSYGVTQESVITSDFPIKKGPIRAAGHSYANYTDDDIYISVPKTYYEYGEDIPIKYKTPNVDGTYRVYITMDEKASTGRYGTWVIKTHNVSKNTSSEIKLSDMNTEYLTSHVLPNDTSYWDTLPPGEYKIWLFKVPDNGNLFGTSYNQYHQYSGFITESLSIKILPQGEANPDFSVTHYSDWEYFGNRNDDNGENWTALTIDNTVYRQGDNIYFNIDGSWEHKWICVVPANEFGNVAIDTGANITNGITARYAQWGHRDYISLGNNFVRTDGLKPGQYKIVYVFGQTLADAWIRKIADYNGHDAFGNNTTGHTLTRIMTVIDITIIDKDSTTQTVTVNYTKGDGTPAETTIAHPLEFFKPITFHTVLDSVKPGTQITFTTQVNGYNKECKLIRNKVSAINYQDADDEKPYIRQGKYVYFGEYPQSLKADFVTIYTEEGTDARGYYRGSDGFYYAYVNAKPQDSSGYTFVNGKPIANGSVYYFRVEPIRWRVVSEDQDQNMVLICESILQNNMFDVTANTWRDSDIRGWLNKYFINKAFTNLQKSYILNTSIDDENDKLYLPSKDDVLNSAYEFDSDASAWDTYRQKLVTDYARATGAFADMTGDEGSGNGIWMLRTPVEDTTNFIWDVSPHGEVTDGGILVNNMAYGVVPMLKLSYSDDVEFYEEYITIEKEVGSSSTYRFNYSALLDGKQTRKAFDSDFAGSYMSVDKTYFLPGEPINVTYFATGSTINNNAWICIADLEMDKYIYWARITKDTEIPQKVDLSQQHDDHSVQNPTKFPNLVPGKEYKIWLLANNYWWDYSKGGDAHYMNPYKDGKIVKSDTGNAYTVNAYAITEPICIKILDPKENDYSLEYKAWIGADTNGDDQMDAMFSHIKLEKNTFVQGEPIKMKFNGRTQYMWAWLCDENGNEIPNTYTGAVTTIGKHPYHENYQYLTDWTEEYYEMENSKNLAPGKYKLYYAVYAGTGMENVYKSGAIVTILDITIVSKEVEATLKLDVVYTNTSGQTVRQTINNNVLLNNLLNSHPGNYDLTDNDNKIEGIVELTDVMPNTKAQFIFLYKKDGEIKPDDVIEIAVDEASAINDIEYSTSSNVAVEKSAFIYKPAGASKAVTNYEGSKLSLPSIYFEYGQPIMATYNVLETKDTPRIIITKEIRNNRGILTGKDIYATCCIKYTNLSKNSEGRIDINNISYHENPFIQNNPEAYEGKLPVGTYKVWFIDDDEDDDKTFLNDEDFAKDPFRKAAPQMITEPITIKVIDPENPDFSIMAESYAPYNGTGQQAGEYHDNTRIILEKAVFTQGEKIRFHVENDYSFRHVMITHSTSSNVTATYEPTGGAYTTTNQGKTWQYAKHGVFNIGDTGASNTLDTSGLNPGQYRIYYLMGANIQDAYNGARFTSLDTSLNSETNKTYSKMFTIIDIIILPKDATQTLTVTYTKYDGTTATITESFPMMGKQKGTQSYNDKTVTVYHSGIDFVKTVTDAQPGTSFVFTVTTNFNAANDTDKKYFEDRFTYTVLKESVKILS